MNRDKLRELIRLVEESAIDELEIRRWGRAVRITKQGAGTTIVRSDSSAATPAPEPVAAPPAAGDESAGEPEVPLQQVTSPMVGTFYRAPAPEAPSFVEIGDTVRPGQTLCILEAMKLMNELQSEVGGIVRRIHVENGAPVEYGQVLFEIEG